MRVLACTILTIATALVAAPVRAQTYDPKLPGLPANLRH